MTGQTATTPRLKISKSRAKPGEQSDSAVRPIKARATKPGKTIRPGVNSYSLYGSRELVIAELLKQPNLARCARKLGMSRATLHKWMQTEEFQAEYRQAREQTLELSIATVGRYVTDAVETLGRNLTCGRPDSEIRAAAVILQWAGKFMPEEFRSTAGAKLADAAQNPAQAAGATIVVVDGTEEDYVAALEQATP